MKIQVHDGLMKSVFTFQPYFKQIWHDLTFGEFPQPDKNEDIRIFNLESRLGNHVQNDMAYLLGDEALLIMEAQSSINLLMDARLEEYHVMLQRQWLTEKGMDTSSHPELARILPFLMAVIYTGNGKNVTIDQFAKGYLPLGLDLRPFIRLYTIENATGLVREYILFCHIWERWKKKYPKTREKAIMETIEECQIKSILKEWMEQKGIKEVVNIMTYAEIQRQEFEAGRRIDKKLAFEKGNAHGRRQERATLIRNCYGQTHDKELVSKILNVPMEEVNRALDQQT